MNNTFSIMPKILKKGLLYFSFAVLGLVIAGFMLPYLYKDKIITFIKEKTNQNLHAEVDFSDANISFFKSFPDVRITIDSLSVMGIDTFDGITLYKSLSTSLDINIPSLLGKEKIPKINSIILDHPEINVVVLDSIHSNYLISKSTEQSSYQLTLEYYRIDQGKITYQDNQQNLFLILEGVNHEGDGDFTQDIFDLRTKTSISKLNVKYGGTQYLTDSKADLQADININFPENKYTLKDNVLKLNELDLTGEGFVQLNGDDINTDASFKTESEEFKSLLSIIPNAYTKDFEKVKTSGKASFAGTIKGTYNGLKNMFPAFDIKILVENGYVKYPSFQQELSNIFADINIKASRPDYKDMSANIPSFSLKVGSDPITGKLVANNLTGDQKVEGNLKGKINLKNLAAAFPIENLDELTGILLCDLEFKAKMSDVNAENYGAIGFKGFAQANDVTYKSKGMPSVNIGKASAKATPSEISMVADNVSLGKSDLNLSGSVKNPLALFSTEKSISIYLNAKSNLFDMNEWMPTNDYKSLKNNEEQAKVTVPNDLIKNTNLFLNLDAKKIKIHEYTIENMKMDGAIAANAIDIRNFSSSLDGSEFKLKGTVVNAYNYFVNNGILDGELDFSSAKFNANSFINNEAPAKSSEPLSVIAVPERVRITIKTDVKELLYTNLILKDFKGNLEIKDQQVAIKNMETNSLGGKISLEGLYNTEDLKHPDFSIKLDLSKIKFAEAISKIDLLKKAAPIAAYIEGFFNTTLVMRGKLGDQMTPDLSSLDMSGFIETLSGSIKGYNPMAVLSEKLGLNALKEIDLQNTKNWFEIVKGFVELKEYKKNIKGVDMSISGKHGFGQNMDYNIELVIPREMMKKNKITAIGESGLTMLEKEASKLGINIYQGPNIFLDVHMTGNFKNPIFKIIPKTGKGENVGDAIESKVEDIAKTLKDTLNKEIKKREAEIKDTITKRANEELEKIKSKAEEAADRALDSIKAKAKDVITNKIDSLTKGTAADSLKQKAKDILDKKTKDEVDKIKDKLKDFDPFKKKGKGG